MVLIAAGGVVGYLPLKRPGDVSNPDAPFTSSEKEDTDALADWPLYGLNPRDEVPAGGAGKAPYKVKWRFKAQALVEYSPIVVGDFMYGINNAGLAFGSTATAARRDGRARSPP